MIELNLELEFHENLNEAFWKVRIPDLPPMFIEAGSAGQIKVDMRKKLKSSLMDDISIERVSKTEMIKKFRELSQGKDIEEIALSFEGVEKCFAIEAGRELRVMVDPIRVNDDESALLAKNIVEKIESSLNYPGQIKVIVIRESRSIETAQ